MVQKICLLLIILLLLSLHPPSVLAENETVGVTIEPIYPNNQREGSKGYFDLFSFPGTKQNVKVKIINKNTKGITLTVKPANAFTNPVGGMLYEKDLDTKDTILLDDAIKLADYINVQTNITIPPLGTAEFPIQISSPKLDKGTILGGVLFTSQGQTKEKEQQAVKGKANFIIKTETTYAIAIQLNLPKAEPPNFEFGDSGFVTENGTIFLIMKNGAQMIQDQITGTYKLKDSANHSLFEGTFGPFKMAPKSQIRYPIQWNAPKLNQGDYVLSVNATINGMKLTKDNKFSIGNKEVNKYIEQNRGRLPNIEKNKGTPVWVWVVVSGLIIGVVMFWLGRRVKKNDKH